VIPDDTAAAGCAGAAQHPAAAAAAQHPAAASAIIEAAAGPARA
jgi:hypothetical protein